MPKKTKYRKSHRGRRKGMSKGGTEVHFGDFGLQAIETSYITGRQIEAARITITRTMQRKGKVWINIFPHKPITTKPAEVRMGSGKGAVEYYVAVVKPGRIMFEISGVSEEVAREAFRKNSFFSDVAVAIISGLGPEGYVAALNYINQSE